MNFHDVVSLFTNVPINKVMVVINKWLEHEKTLSSRMNLTLDDFMSPLEFVMSMMYFQYDGEYYQQVHSVPMGCLDLEDETMDTTPQETRLSMWRHYINDSLVRQNKRDELTEHLNSINTTTSIKFMDEPGMGGVSCFRIY